MEFHTTATLCLSMTDVSGKKKLSDAPHASGLYAQADIFAIPTYGLALFRMIAVPIHLSVVEALPLRFTIFLADLIVFSANPHITLAPVD